MSNGLAIAAVTATLRHILSRGIQGNESGITISVMPPDKAQDSEGNRINLFLYQTTINAAWSNMPLPNRVKPGETGYPPLALNLHYLLTAYNANDQESSLRSQRLLGRAMRVLHDNPVLTRENIEAALAGNDSDNLANSGLGQQIEQVRLTLQPLSLEEMSKLWTIFQTNYRTSVAYQASVVLIESDRTPSAPLPVLQRGREDQGVLSQADLLPVVPTLSRIEIPDQKPGLELGDRLVIHGQRLAGEVTLSLRHPNLEEPIQISNFTEHTPERLVVTLSGANLAAGLYGLSAEVSRKEGEETYVHPTNTLPLNLAPKLTGLNVERVLNDRGQRIRQLQLQVTPAIRPKQEIILMLGSYVVSREAPAQPGEALTFNINRIPPGKYLVRLRIDGVDSLPVVDYTATPARFDEAQTVSFDE